MKNQERKLTLKNYLILLLVFAITIILTLYLCKCYTVYRESIKEIPVIRGTLSEITSEELDHYIQENPNCTVYICTASNPNCRNFEEDFIKFRTYAYNSKSEFLDIYFKQTDDITFTSNLTSIEIPSFAGIYDGAGHILNNIRINFCVIFLSCKKPSYYTT